MNSVDSYSGYGGEELPNTPDAVQSAWAELANLSMDADGSRGSLNAEAMVYPGSDMVSADVNDVPLDDVVRYDVADFGGLRDVDQDFVDELNKDLKAVAPEGYNVEIDLDGRPEDAVRAKEVAQDVAKDYSEQEDSRESKIAALRERLKSRTGFMNVVSQAVRGMVSRVREGLHRSRDMDETTVDNIVEFPGNSKVTEETGQQDATIAQEEERGNEPREYDKTEEEYEKSHQKEQEERRKNLKRLEAVKVQLEQRMWASQDNLMQERLAQAVDEVDGRILAIKAMMVKADDLEQKRFRPRTEMENHGQFALEYLYENGIFEGPYDADGLKELQGLKESLEYKVVKATVDDDERAGSEYVSQLEYVRPAIRELERLLEHPEDWKKMKFLKADQKPAV